MLPSDIVPSGKLWSITNDDKMFDLLHVAFDWKSLPGNSLVVDVGGGIGTASKALAQQFSDLRIVVQDLPLVVENGIKVGYFIIHVLLLYLSVLKNWKQEMPNELASGRVKFEGKKKFMS